MMKTLGEVINIPETQKYAIGYSDGYRAGREKGRREVVEALRDAFAEICPNGLIVKLDPVTGQDGPEENPEKGQATI